MVSEKGTAMIFEQLRPNDGTGTLTYVMGDADAGIAAVLDPTVDGVDEVLATVQKYALRLKYVIDTHTHADHVSGALDLCRRAGAKLIMHELTKTKVIPYDEADRIGIGDTLRENAKASVDIFIEEGDVIEVGTIRLHVLHTPGHTDNHITLRWGHRLFTGDLLLIGQAGRSDLPGGNPRMQYRVFRDKILPMDNETIIYPGHDYAGNINSTLGYERINNDFLSQQSEDDYLAFVHEFFPPMAEVTAGEKVTLQCGTTRVHQEHDNVLEIDIHQFLQEMAQDGKAFLLDVREEFELSMMGKIPGVHNIPMGKLERRLTELPEDLATRIIVICHSGSRSYEAAYFLQQQGYRNVSNLAGGPMAYMMETRVRRSHSTSS